MCLQVNFSLIVLFTPFFIELIYKARFLVYEVYHGCAMIFCPWLCLWCKRYLGAYALIITRLVD